ncbi:hypothetical protein [Lacipirellula sp.]|uniref:hypothetical protein n=1 Tax=Lacipirellula sp. TaxID=2691419 RepID=UPI003D1217B4
MTTDKSRQIDISGRTVDCDSDSDCAILLHAKAVIERREAAENLSLDMLNQVLNACQLYALGEAQHVVREVIANRHGRLKGTMASSTLATKRNNHGSARSPYVAC